MTPEEKALIREIVRDTLREEVPVLLKNRECLVCESGIGLDEHKSHHKALHKLTEDITSVRKAFLIGVVTTVTGGILGLAWLWFKNNMRV